MNRFRKTALVGVALIPLTLGGFLLQSRVTRQSGALLDQVLSIVQSRFVDTLDSSQLYEKAARGLVKELNDPYSELLSPKDLKQFTTRTGGHYGGVGMLIEDQKGQITITKVYHHTPAENAGVHEGDRIIQVDSLQTRGWSLQQVSDYMQGPAGTKVSVKFMRPGVAAPISIDFVRAIIRVPAIQYTMMVDNKIGYIPLDGFNETSASEMRTAVQNLGREGARGIILDFRRNPGGILDQSLEISNLFLKSGQEIATVRARDGEMQPYMATAQPVLPTTPLVVLTDEYTASAAEIVAGALQDHDRALIVGQPSFGKGLVQSVFNLDDGYALKLTTAKWYTPSGRSIQKERKFENGHFVEERPDSTDPEAAKKKRPAFKSDAGRVVYGGGGVTPDVLVRDDTLTTTEQTLAKAIAPKGQDVHTVMYEYAFELSKQVKPGYVFQPAWHDELYRRLTSKGIAVDHKEYDSGARYIDRLLDEQIARLAFGDAAAKQRDIPFDAPLRAAIRLLEQGQNQKDLFTIASGMQAQKQ